MTTAIVFPLFDAFLTILWVFLFVLWIWLVISVIIDVFSSHDLSGVAKALWVLLILLFPLIGVLGYLLIRGTGMSHRRSQRIEQSYRERFDRGGHAGRGSVADARRPQGPGRDQRRGVQPPEAAPSDLILLG